MNRTFTLIALLVLVIGSLVTGCSKSDTTTSAPADTNAPAKK